MILEKFVYLMKMIFTQIEKGGSLLWKSWSGILIQFFLLLQGCIAEQRIAHTCGNHTLDNVISQREQLAADMQHHVHHSQHVQHGPQRHSHHPHAHEDYFSEHAHRHSQENPAQETEYLRGSEHPPRNEYVRVSEFQDSGGQDLQGERRGPMMMMSGPLEEQSKVTQSGLGSNTWPRKRIRVRSTANISTFFHEDISGSRMSIDDNSYACSRVLRGEGGHPDNLPPGMLSSPVSKVMPSY